jgi:hypothetical protein
MVATSHVAFEQFKCSWFELRFTVSIKYVFHLKDLALKGKNILLTFFAECIVKL